MTNRLSSSHRRRFPVSLGTALLICLLCGVGATPASGAPRNDDFADALPIRVGQTLSGTTLGATEEPGEPVHGGIVGGQAGVWYRLQVPRKMAVELNTCLPTGDPAIAVYTGRSLRSLTTIDFASEGCLGTGSRVAFTARPGRTYRIVVAEWDEREAGRFKLAARARKTPRNDDFVDAVPIVLGTPITGSTRNGTLEWGEPRVPFNNHTVWFRMRVAAPTRLRLAVCSPQRRSKLRIYTGRRVNRLTKVATETRRCATQFDAQPGIYRVQVSGGLGRDERFRLTARTVTPVP